MTAGSAAIKNFSTWAMMAKKRHRSGSGGSKDHEAKKMTFLGRRNSGSGRPASKSGSTELASSTAAAAQTSCLEVVAPITADVEFKYTWPIEGFIKHAKGQTVRRRKSSDDVTGHSHGHSHSHRNKASSEVIKSVDGLDSQPFEVHINGVHITWNLSIRFWTGEDGEKLANPFVLCLNMLKCRVDKPTDVGVRFNFGLLNRINGEFEMGAPDTKSQIKLETSNDLRSVGYRNIALSEKHIGAHSGDIQIVCKLKLIKDDSNSHSLSADLKSLLHDEKTADFVLEAGGKAFRVHRNILCARSPVFASLINSETADQSEVASIKEETDVEAGSVPLQHTEQKDVELAEQQHTEAVAEAEANAEIGTEATTEVAVEATATEANASEYEGAVAAPIPVLTECKPCRKERKDRKISRLEIKDLQADTLEELLTYIYTDSSANVDMMANSLLVASETYQLPGLKTHCEKHLGEILSPRNVASLLLLADKYSCQNLKKSALNYCKDNHCYIMKDDQWKAIEEEKPSLFEEAVAEVVAKSSCSAHTECLKKKGKRYEMERNSSVVDLVH